MENRVVKSAAQPADGLFEPGPAADAAAKVPPGTAAPRPPQGTADGSAEEDKDKHSVMMTVLTLGLNHIARKKATSAARAASAAATPPRSTAAAAAGSAQRQAAAAGTPEESVMWTILTLGLSQAAREARAAKAAAAAKTAAAAPTGRGATAAAKAQGAAPAAAKVAAAGKKAAAEDDDSTSVMWTVLTLGLNHAVRAAKKSSAEAAAAAAEATGAAATTASTAAAAAPSSSAATSAIAPANPGRTPSRAASAARRRAAQGPLKEPAFTLLGAFTITAPEPHTPKPPMPLGPLDVLGAPYPALGAAAFPITLDPQRVIDALEELARRAPLLAGRLQNGCFVDCNDGIEFRVLSTDFTLAEWQARHLTLLPSDEPYTLAAPPRELEPWVAPAGEDVLNGRAPLMSVSMTHFAGGGGSLVVISLSHALVDGIALQRACAAVFALVAGRPLDDALDCSRAWVGEPVGVSNAAELEALVAEADKGKPTPDELFLRDALNTMVPGERFLARGRILRAQTAWLMTAKDPLVRRVLIVPQQQLKALWEAVIAAGMPLGKAGCEAASAAAAAAPAAGAGTHQRQTPVSPLDALSGLLWLLGAYARGIGMKKLRLAIRVGAPGPAPIDPLGNGMSMAVARLPAAARPSATSLAFMMMRLSAKSPARAAAGRAAALAAVRTAALAHRACLAAAERLRPELVMNALTLCATRTAHDGPAVQAVCFAEMASRADLVISHTGSSRLAAGLSVDGVPPASVGILGRALLPWVWYTLRSEAGVAVVMPVTAEGWARLEGCPLLPALLPGAQLI